MKWIKTFEELNPKTYRRAGSNLLHMGKSKRGTTLIDHGYKKEFGVYKMHFANSSTLIGKDIEFSSPSYKITIEPNIWNNNEVLNKSITKWGYAPKPTDKDVENMLNKWFDGDRDDISFTINFYFKALSTTKEHNLLKDYQDVPMFSMRFVIASDSQEYKRQLDGDNPDKPLNDASDLWNEIKQWESPQVNMWRPTGHYFGIFSDRMSANKFKRDVYSKAVEDSQELIFEIFSQLGGDTEKLEEFNTKIKNIRINRLYDDELSISSSDRKTWAQHWYTGYSLIPGTDWSDY